MRAAVPADRTLRLCRLPSASARHSRGRRVEACRRGDRCRTGELRSARVTDARLFARRLGSVDGKRLLDVVRFVDVVVFVVIIIVVIVECNAHRSNRRWQILDGQIARDAASTPDELLLATRNTTCGTADGNGFAPANRDDASDLGDTGARYSRTGLSPDRTERVDKCAGRAAADNRDASDRSSDRPNRRSRRLHERDDGRSGYDVHVLLDRGSSRASARRDRPLRRRRAMVGRTLSHGSVVVRPGRAARRPSARTSRRRERFDVRSSGRDGRR